MTSIKNHPFAQKRGKILKHRLIMEKNLGRYLKKSEVVHHINNDPLDNRIENLKLFNNKSEHLSYHSRILKFVRLLRNIQNMKTD